MSEYIMDMQYDVANGTFSTVKREEIVRCRDCKRYIPQGTFSFNDGPIIKDTCDVIRGFVVQIDPNGFCAWGEPIGKQSD